MHSLEMQLIGSGVCMGNLVGLPVIVVPTGFKNISNPPSNGTRRRTTVNTGIYAPPNHDHIVSHSIAFIHFFVMSTFSSSNVGCSLR